jgi:hypothetical protein
MVHALPLVLWMPPELAECWGEPFLRAWFEQTEFLERSILSSRTSPRWRMSWKGGILIYYDSGKVVAAEIAKAYVQTQNGAVQCEPPIGWSVIVANPEATKAGAPLWDESGYAIAHDVCRIFMASGCLPWHLDDSEVIARSMYLCTKELCTNWHFKIVPRCAGVKRKEVLQRRANLSTGASDTDYTRGIIGWGAARIHVHTGPAIDPETRAERYYIALGYSWVPVLRLSSELLHWAIARKLTKFGCQQIPIPESGLREPWKHYQAVSRRG